MLAVCRLSADAPVPLWAQGPITCVCRTPDELSIVCSAEHVPEGVRCEQPYRALRIAGTLDFALTGILSAITVPLAVAQISIFAISTFDTDYVLVREEQLSRAIAALTAAGHEVR